MMDRMEPIRDFVASTDKRRWLLVFLLLVLALLGVGLGTVDIEDENLPGVTIETPAIEEGTPAPGTPTPTPGEPTPTPGGPTETPGESTGETPASSGPSPPTGTPNDGEPESSQPVDRTSTTPTGTPSDTPTTVSDDDPDTDQTEETNSEPGDTSPPGGGDSQPSSGVELAVRDNTAGIRATNLFPGDQGATSFTVANAGDSSAALLAGNVSVVDSENSVLEPERAAGDRGPPGELSSALRVRVSVSHPDQSREYLFGGPDSYVPLESLDGISDRSGEIQGGDQATVTVEWKLPASVGNEVQSDGVAFDLDFFLVG